MKISFTPIPTLLVWLAVIGMFCLSSCKKEYADYPYNDIEKFTVTDAEGNSLEGALVGDSIWVYWPPFQTVPDSISPIISISKNATISPASNEKVSFNTGTAYTVVSESGLSKAYYLKAAINEPRVIITRSPNNIPIGSNISMRGQYLITDTNRTHVNLIDEDDKVIPVKLSPENLSSVYFEATIPIDGSVLPDKNYTIQLVSGSQSFSYGPFLSTMSGANLSTIGYQLDQAGSNIKRGEIVSFTYSPSYMDTHYFNYEGSLQLYIMDEETKAQTPYTANLISVTDMKLTYQIGEDVPLGKITTVIIFGQQLRTESLAVRFAEAYLEPYTTSIVE